MIEEYSLIDKVKTGMGYALAGAAFVGFCYLYGNAMTEGRNNCRFITMSPVTVVCDEKPETNTNLRELPLPKTLDKVLIE